jgi:hypothetical protein
MVSANIAGFVPIPRKLMASARTAREGIVCPSPIIYMQIPAYLRNLFLVSKMPAVIPMIVAKVMLTVTMYRCWMNNSMITGYSYGSESNSIRPVRSNVTPAISMITAMIIRYNFTNSFFIAKVSFVP